MAAAVGVMAASLAFIGPRVADIAGAHRSDQEQIVLKPLAERSYIFDSHGNLQGTMTNRDDPQNRSRVELDEIPETVVGSVLAMEDDSFYEHKGVNVRAILRAADANIESGGIAQGGSTITQQVVKNSLVGDDQSLSRKLREAVLALELERQMSKDEILEYYLNSVYFGGGAYGVQAAAEFYFRKDVSELDWAEGALLAALIRSPNTNNPFRNPSIARDQRSVVLGRLVDTDRLTEAEAEQYEDATLPTNPNRPAPPYDYFVEEVKRQLLTDPKFGLGATEEARHRSVYEGGIRVYTTFDQRLQLHALSARNETLPANKGDATFDVVNPEDGQVTFGTQAIASVEPSSGAVKVMVGGPGYERWQLNLTTSRRQPGSTMKTFVAATLFEQDFVPTDTVSGGGSCTFEFPGESETITYRGRGGTIASMTAASSNCGYMKLGQIAGVGEVADVAGKVGIKTSLFDVDRDGNPTAPPHNLPLGTKEVTPLEMASAYATFANDGIYNEPYFVERIEDHSGRVIYQHQPRPVRAVSEQTARLVTDVLQGVVRSGTGTRAQVAGGQPAAGKTGTTDDSTDVWFVGYTPRLSTAVWIGAPKGQIPLGTNRDLAGATGGRFAAATWGRFYSTAFEGEPILEFDAPESTRRGKWMGRVPNEIGGGGSTSRSSTTPRRRSTPRAAEPAPAPTAPTPTPTPTPTPAPEADPEPPADDGPGNGPPDDGPGNGGGPGSEGD